MNDSPAHDPVPVEEGAEVEQLRRQLEEKQDRLLRALAETDNVRRRAQRDREEYLRYANEAPFRDLIPATGEAPGVTAGIELIQRELFKVLERHGVTRYSAMGQPFDPTRHEAVDRVLSVDQAPNTVVREVAPGYLLNGRVLRPALVAVAASDEDAA
jgi:molecular chaperone GrpE